MSGCRAHVRGCGGARTRATHVRTELAGRSSTPTLMVLSKAFAARHYDSRSEGVYMGHSSNVPSVNRIKLVLPLSTTATTKFFFPFLRATNGFAEGALRVICAEGSSVDGDACGRRPLADEKNDAKYARIPVPAPVSTAVDAGRGTSSFGTPVDLRLTASGFAGCLASRLACRAAAAAAALAFFERGIAQSSATLNMSDISKSVGRHEVRALTTTML